MLNIQQLRQDTPACERLVHFNNAGSALSPRKVTEAVISHLRHEQEFGGYEAAALASSAIQNFYTAMATLLNCQVSEIAFVENATRAWELALYSIPLQAGDEIITFECEYASNYMGLLHLAKQKALKLTVAPMDREGRVDVAALQSLLGERTKVIALTHIASQRGDIQPAAAVGAVAREHGIYYLLDACQSAGQCVLDVAELGCDFLAGTGRKYLRGPRGTGFLFVNQQRLPELNPIFVDLHAAQWQTADSFIWHEAALRFETFERHVAGMIGLGVAVNYANNLGLPAIQQRIQTLAGILRNKLRELPTITVHERSPHFSGIVTFSKADEPAELIKQRLASEGINTTVSKHSNARLDLDRENLDAVLRASVHYYNTEIELERLVDLLD